MLTNSTDPQIAVIDFTDKSVADLLALLSPDCGYAEQIAQFSSAKRQREWLATRLALQQLCGAHKAIAHLPSGKPYLPQEQTQISISHTDNYAAVIISHTQAVAIDIERTGSKALRLSARFMTAEEQQFLQSLPQQHQSLAATLCWSIKETIYKLAQQPALLVTDISVPPFTLPLTNSGTLTVPLPNTPIQTTVHYQIHPDYALVHAATPSIPLT